MVARDDYPSARKASTLSCNIGRLHLTACAPYMYARSATGPPCTRLYPVVAGGAAGLGSACRLLRMFASVSAQAAPLPPAKATPVELGTAPPIELVRQGMRVGWAPRPQAGSLGLLALGSLRSELVRGRFCRRVRSAEWCVGAAGPGLFHLLSTNSPTHCLVVPPRQRLKCE